MAKSYMSGYDKDFYSPNWNTRDTELINRVQNNLFKFSAAKSYSETIEMRDAVYDADGNIRPFADFKESARKITGKFNEAYLATERQHVIAAGTQGSRWRDIEESMDTHPYLMYVTKRDSHVRDTHRLLDGIVLPADDPFWNEYYPPNDWNCRCSTRKLTAREAEHYLKQYKGSPPSGSTAAKMAEQGTPKLFRQNVGKSELFSEDEHPYYRGLPGAKAAQLSAVDNYGMSSAKQIYAKGSGLETYTKPIETPEEFDTFWQQCEEKHGKKGVDGFTLVDKQNLQLATFTPEIKTKMAKRDYFPEVLNTFTDPHEVWAVKMTSGSALHNIFLRYYEDAPIALIVNAKGLVENLTRIKDLAEVEKLRKGLLKRRK